MAPVPDGHRLLHVLPAPAHGDERVGERERRGGHERAVLAQAVARDPVGPDSACHERAQRGDAGGEDGRLRVRRELQLGLGSLEAEPRQREAERCVRLREDLAALGERVSERPPHPDLLRALAREHEREAHALAASGRAVPEAARPRATSSLSIAALTPLA